MVARCAITTFLRRNGISITAYLLTLLLALSCSARRHGPARIFYLNSYHQGYVPSDQILEGLLRKIDTTEVRFKSFYLDAKRLTADELANQADEAARRIRGFNPDVLIVSDDNAMQSVVMRYFSKPTFPIVFCGVNWSAASYDLTDGVITGMVEVLPVSKCIEAARSSGLPVRTITVLSENSAAEEKNKPYISALLSDIGLIVTYKTVDNFGEWKREFIRSQSDADIVFIPTQGSVSGWCKHEAIQFVSENISKPVFTCDDFMMPYACYGFTKVSQEQGTWAATAALDIINGAEPKEIPVAVNRQQNCFVNQVLCDKIGLKFPQALLKNCKGVIQ